MTREFVKGRARIAGNRISANIGAYSDVASINLNRQQHVSERVTLEPAN